MLPGQMPDDGESWSVPPPSTPTDAVLFPLLRRAGQAALAFAGRAGAGRIPCEHKDDGSPVTDADRAAEAILVQGLSAAFPQDAIIGEEGSHHPGTSGRTWVIDPIDGTAAFTHGLAYWGPTVACLEGQRPVIGALHLPRTGDYWFADLVTGTSPAAWHDGHLLPPLSDALPDRAAVLFVPSRLHHVATVDWPGKLRCLGSTAAHLALVASGAAHAALVGPSPAWDTAAGSALIEAVGGVVSGLVPGGLVAGRPTSVEHLLAEGTIRLFEDPLAHLH